MSRVVTDLLIGGCFNANFRRWHNVQIIGGADEPLYLPAVGKRPATIRYTRDYARSALHEIAHWCIAGEARRHEVDYGYWYSPPPRSAVAQRAFCAAEVAVQALEMHFSHACGVRFSVSMDDLDGGLESAAEFNQQVAVSARQLGPRNMTKRASRMVQLLRALGSGHNSEYGSARSIQTHELAVSV